MVAAIDLRRAGCLYQYFSGNNSIVGLLMTLECKVIPYTYVYVTKKVKKQDKIKARKTLNTNDMEH